MVLDRPGRGIGLKRNRIRGRTPVRRSSLSSPQSLVKNLGAIKVHVKEIKPLFSVLRRLLTNNNKLSKE